MPHEYPKFTEGDLKKIKQLIFFVVLILVFQGLQYVITKNTTKKYTNLFSEGTELMNRTNSLLCGSSNIQRFMLNVILSDDSIEIKKFGRKIDSTSKIIEAGLVAIKRDNVGEENNEIKIFPKNVADSWKEYKEVFSQYFIYKRSDKASVNNYRKSHLRPKFEKFHTNLVQFLAKISGDQNALALKIASGAENQSFFLLIFGNFVLLILVVFLLYILISENSQG